MSRFLLLLLFPILISGNCLFSQTAKPKAQEAKISVQKMNYAADFVRVDFEIPFPGMIEVRIFKGESEMVYMDQDVFEKGKNQLKFKADAFEKGKKYFFKVNYKQDVYENWLTIPAS